MIKIYKLVILVIILIINLSICNGQNNNNEFPYLGMMVEGYKSTYYEYPNNFSDFSDFLKRQNWPKRFNYTIKKLEKNKKNIKWEKNKDTLIVKINNKIIYNAGIVPLCNVLLKNWPYYLQRILLFDKKGHYIKDDKMKNKFKERLTKLKSNYKK
jgi:hypothetical protein